MNRESERKRLVELLPEIQIAYHKQWLESEVDE